MSDPQYGEPVDESTSGDDVPAVDDVVGSANEGLAEAEAASRDAVDAAEADRADAAASVDEPAYSAASADDLVVPAGPADEPVVTPSEPVAYAPEPVEPVVAYEADATDAGDLADAGDRSADHDLSYLEEHNGAVSSEPFYQSASAYPETAVYADSAAGREQVDPVVVPASPQPIFVQAPEAPRPRGNRAAAGAIGLLAAVAFGILYLGAALGFGAIAGDITGENVGTEALAAVTSWWFWVPVAVFFIAFWLLGAIINRGRWGHWVIFGLLVGVAAYGGHLLGQLFQAPFWTLTASQGAALVNEQLLAPLAVVALVIGREITIWFGAWVSARGKRVTELNIEAQREYERTLEAGPQLHRY